MSFRSSFGALEDAGSSWQSSINIKTPNPSLEPPASFKAPNKDLDDMYVFCTFKIKIESHNSDHDCIQVQWSYLNEDQDAKPQSGTSNNLQIPISGLKEHGCSLHPQNQVREPNLDPWNIKDQWPYPNQDQHAKCQSGSSGALQSPKWGLKWHVCFLHLQNQDREPKFDHGYVKDKWPYKNQDQDAKLQSAASSVFNYRKTKLKFVKLSLSKW